jgi:hypothetical protein
MNRPEGGLKVEIHLPLVSRGAQPEKLVEMLPAAREA